MAGGGSRRNASEQRPDGRSCGGIDTPSGSGLSPDLASAGRAPWREQPGKRMRATPTPRAGRRESIARAHGGGCLGLGASATLPSGEGTARPGDGPLSGFFTAQGRGEAPCWNPDCVRMHNGEVWYALCGY